MKRQYAQAPQTEVPTDPVVTRTLRLTVEDPEAKREEIRAYFRGTASLYESLFDCLVDDAAFYIQPNPLRHPHIFYFGHTAVFYINKLKLAGLIQERLDPKLESVLSVGVDEMSWDDVNSAHYDWPEVDAVRAYRSRVQEIVEAVISGCEIGGQIGWDHPLWIVMMGIEHERIHLETSSVLMRETDPEHLRPHPLWGRICREHGEPPENALLPVEGGRLSLGKERGDPFYGWDNEYGRLEVDVPAFRASQRLVSNREFQAFVDDGGYQSAEHWTEEGWAWVTYKGARQPAFWRDDAGGLRYRTMLELIDMPWDWPVHVNALEAQAFCRWKSARSGVALTLPTEAQWYRLRACYGDDQPTWPEAPGNINLEGAMSSCPVTRHAFPGGFYDIVGNAWQWTRTPIAPYEGFEIHPAYDDFSVPTFDGRHDLIKGGCWISTGNYAIKRSRYAFRRHFLQHSGFRYVASPSGSELRARIPDAALCGVHKGDAALTQSVEFHYGDSYFGVPNFPRGCARIGLAALGDRPRRRALDLGCATGRAAFELALSFDAVDGVDFTARNLQVPGQLQREGTVHYEVPDEGELVTRKAIHLGALGYDGVKDRVSFMQGDACNLSPRFSDYDLVLALNLLDRLYDPAAFLTSIHQRIRPGGVLVIASPYTWLREHTPREKWLGGFYGPDGEAQTTLDGIRRLLSPAFDQEGEAMEVPLGLRETRRKFQHSTSELTLWRRWGG